MGMLDMMTEVTKMVKLSGASFRRVPAPLVAKRGIRLYLWILILSVGNALLWIGWCIGRGRGCRRGEF